MSGFEAVKRPIDVARTLPPASYYDPAMYEVERVRIFHRGWRAVGFVDQVPAAGDAYPLRYADAPLLLVHGQDGVLRLFHNIVPYDAAPVLLEPARGLSELASAYHGLVFTLEGALSRAPFWNGDPAADRSAVQADLVDLIPVPCRTWGRVVFANIDGRDPDGFERTIAPLEDLLGGITFAALAPERYADGTLALTDETTLGNWKTHHENACINVYHEAAVHAIYRVSTAVPRLTNTKRNYRPINDRGLRGLSYTKEEAGDTYLQIPFPPLPRHDARDDGNVIVSLYPGLYVSVIGAHVHLTIASPMDAEHTRLQSLSLFHPDVAADEESAPIRAAVAAAWDEAVSEDGRIIAAIQAGRRSPVAQAGFFAPFWDEAHHDFLKQVVADLEET
ncbi:hypothetical protein LC593_33880 [Nostoc sp. CHAB 5844]|nr:hypothetical protein [Nostoc sp. CHAB 5844]